MIGMQLGCGLFSSGGSAGIGLAETEFPIGSVARLVDAFKDYTGREVVETFTKMPNGNWASGSQHNEYFTSFEKLNFKHAVQIVMYGGVELWPVDRRTPPARPMIDSVLVPAVEPVMLPDAKDAAAEAAPWSPPAPRYDAPPQGSFVPGPARPGAQPQYQAAPAEKSNNGLLALLAGLAFVFLR